MAGVGCLAAAASAPYLFSAMLAVCGAFTLPMSPRTSLREVVPRDKKEWTDEILAPVLSTRAWLFHGSKDMRIPVEGSSRLYGKVGGKTKVRNLNPILGRTHRADRL